MSFSDHSLILYNLNICPINSKVEKHIEFRKYVDSEPFKTTVTSRLYTQPGSSSHQLALNTRQAILQSREEHFPLLSKRIIVSGASPWYDGAWKEAKLECRRAERHSRAHPDDPMLRSRYLNALKNSASVLKSRKSHYYNEFFKDMRNSPCTISSTVATILGKPNERALPELAYTSPVEFCKIFNEFLFEKIQKIREDLDRNSAPINREETHLQSTLTEFKPVTKADFDTIRQRCRITYLLLTSFFLKSSS